jgi:hypothetical protein
MRIGLDFDDVIADYQEVKARIVRERYGIEVPKMEMKSGTFRNADHPYSPLTLELYEEIQEVALLAVNHEFLSPIEGAIEGIQELLRRGHELQVITSRQGGALKAAGDWLKGYGFDFSVTGVGKDQSKRAVLMDQQIECFIDDRSRVFEDLHDLPIQLFQLGGRGPIPPGVTRVSKWAKFLQCIA